MKAWQTQLRRAGISSFLLAIVLAILLAWLRPTLGVSTALDQIAFYGVALIFFFYGLYLNPAQLTADLSNWRVHALIQTTTFVVFPLLALALKPFFTADYQTLWIGVFFLAALPSTVSSSVVMVSAAGGNVTAAIFNATVSGFLGIILTPLWTSLYLSASGDFDFAGVILKLCLQVLLPVSAGMLLHKVTATFMAPYKSRLKVFDQSVIVLIIYTSFCRSFAEGVFTGFGWPTVLTVALAVACLFLLVFFGLRLFATKLGLARPDIIAVVFCGSKKSLVHGTVMSKVLFQGNAALGVILLPLMLYHAFQLMMSSVMAQRYGELTDSR